MKKFTKCKIAGPAKATGENMAAIALVDTDSKFCMLVPVEPHQNEIFVAIFCANANFSVPLIHDFLSELLNRIEKIPGYKVEELRIEMQDYLRARIIFEDGGIQELRVEDALALAGRNNWTINVQTSLLSKNDGSISPQKNPALVSEMEDRRTGMPDDFGVVSLECKGWNLLKKN